VGFVPHVSAPVFPFHTLNDALKRQLCRFFFPRRSKYFLPLASPAQSDAAIQHKVAAVTRSAERAGVAMAGPLFRDDGSWLFAVLFPRKLTVDCQRIGSASAY
jgi:hypothetical protein